MSTVPARRPAHRNIVLRGVRWKTYVQLIHVFAEYRAVRLTYDRGVLEIMSLLLQHDGDADFLGQMVVILTDELNLQRLAGGSVTLRRRDRKRGLGPTASRDASRAVRRLRGLGMRASEAGRLGSHALEHSRNRADRHAE
jgi:hypothetical protein